jgi:hypothetical protein
MSEEVMAVYNHLENIDGSTSVTSEAVRQIMSGENSPPEGKGQEKVAERV